MLYAAFSDIKEATAHRAAQGGWLFTIDGGNEVLWFSLAFTASTIMTHRTVRGLSGKLF